MTLEDRVAALERLIPHILADCPKAISTLAEDIRLNPPIDEAGRLVAGYVSGVQSLSG